MGTTHDHCSSGTEEATRHDAKEVTRKPRTSWVRGMMRRWRERGGEGEGGAARQRMCTEWRQEKGEVLLVERTKEADARAPQLSAAVWRGTGGKAHVGGRGVGIGRERGGGGVPTPGGHVGVEPKGGVRGLRALWRVALARQWEAVAWDEVGRRGR